MKDLFPYDVVRPYQDKLIRLVEYAMQGSNLVVHAPTGLGKTVASIAPSIAYAIEHDLTVLFLTSRKAQHQMVLRTVKDITEKSGENIVVADIMGKQTMCAFPNVSGMYSSEFFDYCRKLREDKKCDYYLRTKKNNDFTTEAGVLISNLSIDFDKIVARSKERNLCPYEISLGVARKARIIVADYFYAFHPKISDTFFAKIGKTLEDCIIIVDEGHNLPSRIRELMTERLSLNVVSRAIKESTEFRDLFEDLGDILNDLANGVKNERFVSKDEFVSALKEISPYEIDELITRLSELGDEIREEKKRSSIGSVAQFLEAWMNKSDGFARILSVRNNNLVLSYRCLDPSKVSAKVIARAHSVILMSGTLNPPSMYLDLLGFPDNTATAILKSPFPKKNRLNMTVPLTSTKYERRSEEEFKKMAKICADIVDEVGKNTLIFFPSYYMLEQINDYFKTMTTKPVFVESQLMTPEEKDALIESFKAKKDSGSALLAAVSGSFGEGIDLPGDYLKCVIIVGLPFSQPDLESKALIEYYDKLFGKGWDYGYTFPAFNKVLQNAGRCIRTEKDKGIVVFLDERYAWSKYQRCFPSDWDVHVSSDYMDNIRDFEW